MATRALRGRQEYAIPDAWVRRWRSAGGRVLGDLPGVEVAEPTLLSSLPTSGDVSVKQSSSEASSDTLRPARKKARTRKRKQS